MSNYTERAAILRPLGISPLLTTYQLMAYYGVSDWTVNEWVKKGCPVEPTAFRGRRFELDAVRAWMTTGVRVHPEAVEVRR
ncbi:hypothetical protein [Streptomyces sp. NPDC088847]|uniref:hypothetical protein n=1 Tax=Streptomyces sp. NPDC088847 TaxID=3365909 RepID=UPI0038255223